MWYRAGVVEASTAAHPGAMTRPGYRKLDRLIVESHKCFYSFAIRDVHYIIASTSVITLAEHQV